MQPDLIAQWLALPDLTEAQRDHLGRIGVTREAIHRAGGLAWTQVTTTGRTFTPVTVTTTNGNGALVTAAWAGAAPSIYQAVEDPRITDLIAFHPARPDVWWRRLGVPGAVLGEDRYLDAVDQGQPVRLFSTPLEWLQANCDGTVFLDDAEDRWIAERAAIAS